MSTPAAAHAAFEALPDAAAVLKADGSIVATNLAWRMFSVDNGGSPETTDVGINYLDVCDRSGGAQHDDARAVAAALRDVLAGIRIEAEAEYQCPAPDKRRWFRVHITRLPGPGGGAVVTHHNITRTKIADMERHPLADMVDPLTGVVARLALETKLRTTLELTRKRRSTPDVGLIRVRLDGYAAVRAQFGQIAADRDATGPGTSTLEHRRPGQHRRAHRTHELRHTYRSDRTGGAGATCRPHHAGSGAAPPHPRNPHPRRDQRRRPLPMHGRR